MLGVDVVDMFGATQVGTAIGYLTTELERIRRREHVVDMPTVSLSATWVLGTGRCVFYVVDIETTARGNSIKVLTRMAPEMRYQLAGCPRPLVQAIRVPSGPHSATLYPGRGRVRL